MSQSIQPTAEDKDRDLLIDLKLCEAATPGPWIWYHPSEFPKDIRIARTTKKTHDIRGYICRLTKSHSPKLSGSANGAHLPPRDEDARLMATARDGWPAAIRRAMAAEAELKQLHESFTHLWEMIETVINQQKGQK